jgi:predicted DNA-binding transcriptional regulator AlpA
VFKSQRARTPSGVKDSKAALFSVITMLDDKPTARPRGSTLPLSLPPRGLSRVQAAEYIGVSPSTFDKMVSDGQMPPPKKMRGRVVWDRKRLDQCFDAFDDDGENQWD